MKKSALTALFLALFFVRLFAYEIKDVNIVILADGDSAETSVVTDIFRKEIEAVTAGSYKVHIKTVTGVWTDISIASAMSRLQKDTDTDVIIALGLISGQIALSSEKLYKPTFVPYTLKLRAPHGRKKNLNCLTIETDLASEMERFMKAVSFRNPVLLLDSSFRTYFQDEIMSAAESVNLKVIYNSEINEDLTAKLPEGTDAVIISPLPRLSSEAQKKLADAFIEKKIPSFAPFDFDYAEKGFLMAVSSESDSERRARRTAVNILEVLKGGKAEAQAVFMNGKRELVINMATASKLGIAIPFSVLEDAVLINKPDNASEKLTLGDAVQEAVKANLGIIAGELGVRADNENTREIRSALFPQITAQLSYTQMDSENDYVKMGSYAEKSTDGSLTLKQIIFSEKVLAQLEIQKELHTALKDQQKVLELETGRQAASAFINMLTAQTNYKIQQDNLKLYRINLELARGRVQAGVSDMSDVYYWESNISTAKQSVLHSASAAEKARNLLNRILNRPPGAQYYTVPATLDGLNLTDDVQKMAELITDEKRYSIMSEYFIKEAVTSSPELTQIGSRIKAQSRQLLSEKRSYYAPDVYLYGSLDHVFDEEREKFTGVDMEGDTNWQAGIGLSIPIFEGGAKSARTAKGGISLNRLRVYYSDSKNEIEQNILNDLSSLRASYQSIKLAADASGAAKKSFYLIRENYAEGTRPMTDLLAAQNASVSADLSSANAVYRFMQDMVNLQRDMGSFSLFLNDAEHREFTDKLIKYVNNKE